MIYMISYSWYYIISYFWSIFSANEDFIPLSDQLVFNNTQTDHVVQIEIRDDLIFEGLQVFYVELNTTSEQVLLTDETRTALIQIRDGDTSGKHMIYLVWTHD